jgi:PIN domain nuclease of toxin-antitoxin system
MSLLLDTNVLIWCLLDSPTLSDKARQAINDENTQVVVSAASVWEIRIKQKINKIRKFPLDFYERLILLPFNILPMTAEHANATYDLPLIHRDPFDRMLIAQSLVECLTLVTRDEMIEKYRVPILKA